MRRWNGWGDEPYPEAEKGELAFAVIADVARRLDPDGLMVPGKLLPGGVT